MSVNPKQPHDQGDENYQSLMRFFATKKLRASLTSPPLAKDVGELEFVFDKTALRLYTKVDNTLRYVTFT